MPTRRSRRDFATIRATAKRSWIGSRLEGQESSEGQWSAECRVRGVRGTGQRSARSAASEFDLRPFPPPFPRVSTLVPVTAVEAFAPNSYVGQDTSVSRAGITLR
jgi:hypothetical protein